MRATSTAADQHDAGGCSNSASPPLEGGTAALAVASGAAAVEYALRNISPNPATTSSPPIPSMAAPTTCCATRCRATGSPPRSSTSPTTPPWRRRSPIAPRLVYFETFGNPNADLPDFEAIAAIAHRHGLPVIVDNTFATPYLFRPLEHGADIVVESATKFLGGHGTTLGGVIVEGGRFDWAAGAGGFPTLTEPDPSYHGLRFFEALGPTAFVTPRPRRAAARHRRDDLAVRRVPAAAGIETLTLRVERHVDNALRVIEYLRTVPRGRFDLAPLDRGARGPRTLPALPSRTAPARSSRSTSAAAWTRPARSSTG